MEERKYKGTLPIGKVNSRSAEIRWKSKRYSRNIKEVQSSNAKRKC